MILRTKMKEYRAKHSLSQDDLAKAVGVRRETISNIENGKYNPSLKLGIDIAKELQVPVEELFYFDEE